MNIDLNFQQLVQKVKQLSPDEKLILNDFIWDEKIKIPLSHQTIVLDRIKEAKKDPTRLWDWEEVAKFLNG